LVSPFINRLAISHVACGDYGLNDALPRRLGETRLTDLIDDRRFAETIYRVALADGITDRVTYQDPPEDAS